MHLERVHSLALTPTAPFNFDATLFKPDHFPSGDNHWEPGIRWQTCCWEGRQLGLKIINTGDLESPAVQVYVYCTTPLNDENLAGLREELNYRYNLDLDLTGFYSETEQDPLLRPVVERLWGMRPGHAGSLYEYLMIGIVLQNTTINRSIQMLQTLFEHHGRLLSFDDKELWCFWQPGGLQAVSQNDLRALKFGYRAKSLKRIDNTFAAREIDELILRHASLETQRSALLKLFGVGPATVWYLLFDVFHRYDFFDHISPWEQKIYSRLFFDRDPEDPAPVDDLLNFFDIYGKYRQLAVHYFWQDLWWRHREHPMPWLAKLIRR